jgi:hypothetical protein
MGDLAKSIKDTAKIDVRNASAWLNGYHGFMNGVTPISLDIDATVGALTCKDKNDFYLNKPVDNFNKIVNSMFSACTIDYKKDSSSPEKIKEREEKRKRLAAKNAAKYKLDEQNQLCQDNPTDPNWKVTTTFHKIFFWIPINQTWTIDGVVKSNACHKYDSMLDKYNNGNFTSLNNTNPLKTNSFVNATSNNSNDNINNATLISGEVVSVYGDNTNATLEEGEFSTGSQKKFIVVSLDCAKFWFVSNRSGW